MAVNENVYPIETGTGEPNNPKLTYLYGSLISPQAQGTLQENTPLSDDSICYATMSNSLGNCPWNGKYLHFNNISMSGAGVVDIEKEYNGYINTSGLVLGRYEGIGFSSLVDLYPLQYFRYAPDSETQVTNAKYRFCSGFSYYKLGLWIEVMYIECADTEEGYIPSFDSGDYTTINRMSLQRFMNEIGTSPNRVCIGATARIIGVPYEAGTTSSDQWTIIPFVGINHPVMQETQTENLYDWNITELMYTFSVPYSGTNNQGQQLCMPLVDGGYTIGTGRNVNQSLTRVIIGSQNAYDLWFTKFADWQGTVTEWVGCITRVQDLTTLLSACACYGLPFYTTQPDLNFTTIEDYIANNGNIGFIPITEEDGTFAGRYRPLADFFENSSPEENPAYTDDDDEFAEINSNPDFAYDNISQGGGNYPPPEPEYITKTPLNEPAINPTGVFNRVYALSLNDVKALADYIYNADDSIYDRIIDGLKFMGENPANALIQLSLTPFDITTLINVGVTMPIKLGRTQLEVQALAVGDNIVTTIDLGSVQLPKYHDDTFLSFAPYTTANLYIPYIGIMDIDTKDIAGKTVNIKMIIDWNCNACCACVFANGMLVSFRTGTINTNIAMTSVDNAIDLGNITSAILGGTVGAVTAGMAGNVAGAVMGGFSTLANTYNAIAQPTQYKSVGSTTSNLSSHLPNFPYFVISTVKPKIPENYGHSVGYACDYTAVLSSQTGFTVCTGVKFSGAKTTEENRLINELLEDGVIV